MPSLATSFWNACLKSVFLSLQISPDRLIELPQAELVIGACLVIGGGCLAYRALGVEYLRQRGSSVLITEFHDVANFANLLKIFIAEERNRPPRRDIRLICLFDIGVHLNFGLSKLCLGGGTQGNGLFHTGFAVVVEK